MWLTQDDSTIAAHQRWIAVPLKTFYIYSSLAEEFVTLSIGCLFVDVAAQSNNASTLSCPAASPLERGVFSLGSELRNGNGHCGLQITSQKMSCSVGRSLRRRCNLLVSQLLHTTLPVQMLWRSWSEIRISYPV